MPNSIRGFLRRGGADRGGERQASRTPYAQAGVIILCMMLTEVHMLFPEWDNDYKWQIYNTLQEVAKALVCLSLMGVVTKVLRPTMLLASVWWTTQAQQEFMDMNDGTTQTWEYWLVALMAVAIIVQLRLTKE